MPEMTGVLGHHPAVIQADVAAPGEAGDDVGGAVAKRMLAIPGLDGAGEADHVALGQADLLAAVEREFPGIGERHPGRIGDDQPLALGEAAWRSDGTG